MYQSSLPFVLPTASSASPQTSPLPAALSGVRPTISKWRNHFILNTQIITEFTDYPTNMGIKNKYIYFFPLSHSVCYIMHFMIVEIKLDLLYSFTDVSHASVVKAGVKRKFPSGTT